MTYLPPKLHFLPARNEVKHAFSSHDKVKQFFNIPAPVPLKEGLIKMYDWVRQVGSRKTENFAGIEIPFGLPRGW